MSDQKLNMFSAGLERFLHLMEGKPGVLEAELLAVIHNARSSEERMHRLRQASFERRPGQGS
jgi:hypothetical protein